MQQIRKDEVPGKCARLCSDTVSATASKGEQGERLHSSGFLNSGYRDTNKGRTAPSLHVNNQRENSSKPSRQQPKGEHLQAFTSTTKGNTPPILHVNKGRTPPSLHVNKGRTPPSLHVNNQRENTSKPSRQQPKGIHLPAFTSAEGEQLQAVSSTNKGRTAPQLGFLNIGYTLININKGGTEHNMRSFCLFVFKGRTVSPSRVPQQRLS